MTYEESPSQSKSMLVSEPHLELEVGSEEEQESVSELESELELEVDLEVADASIATLEGAQSRSAGGLRGPLHAETQPATNRNLVLGCSQAQLVPSYCGRMCTLTNEDIIALRHIATRAMNINNIFIFAFGSSACLLGGSPTKGTKSKVAS